VIETLDIEMKSSFLIPFTQSHLKRKFIFSFHSVNICYRLLFVSSNYFWQISYLPKLEFCATIFSGSIQKDPQDDNNFSCLLFKMWPN